jgi:hypothetical protein
MTIETSTWQFQLKRGKYMLVLEAGKTQFFDVLGTGAVDVNF